MEKLVEKPLRPAVHDFWEKGILVYQCSANQEGAKIGVVWIEIAVEALTSENLEVARQNHGFFMEKNGRKVVRFSFPVTENTFSAEVISRTRALAAQFISQK